MKNIFKTLMLGIGLFPLGMGAQSVDTTKYTDYTPYIGEPDPSLLVYGSANEKKHVETVDISSRPDHVNNMEARCFPPVFSQSGGSCGSASRIGYMFTHELNALRNADGSLVENWYPTHFVWLFTRGNSGKDAFVTQVGVPSAATYGGRTYSALFGNQSDGDEAFGWMNGYEKWYSGMFNRVETVSHIPANVGTREGREAVKNWLWNHNGDADFVVGGLGGIGVATGPLKNIPSTPANDENGFSGLKCVDHWGDQVNHALTIVGYDDRVEFDLDGDGIYGEADVDEKGAWIIVNSWGTKWANGGAVYCPYAYGGKRFNKNADGSYTFDTRSWWVVEVFKARKNYRPLRTIKLKMDYSHRSELCLSAGVATDINARVPERTLDFHHFHYAGDGARGTKNPAPAVPMLGRWADGKLHTEPMEFGYDLTDLTAGYDRSQPLKYFFIIKTRDWGIGKGHLYNAAIVDYEFDKNGVEFPFAFPTDGLEIKSQGNTTVITAVVRGEGYSAPEQLRLHGQELKWAAPLNTMYEVAGYKVYKNARLLSEVDKKVTAYNLPVDEHVATYGVSTVYVNGVESVPRQLMSGIKPTVENEVLDFDDAGFTVCNLFRNKYDAATVEFWIAPQSLENGAFEVDLEASHFFIHGYDDGRVATGWDDNRSSRFTTSAPVLSLNRWTHVAAVVNRNKVDLYINGLCYGSATTPVWGGLGDMDKFVFHKGKKASHVDAVLDEVKVWNYARTAADIQRDYKVEYFGQIYPMGLMAYYKGQMVREGYRQLVFDCVGGNHGMLNGTEARVVSDGHLNLTSSTEPVQVKFASLSTPVKVAQPVVLHADYSSAVTTLKWNIPTLGIQNLEMENPKVKFNKVGKYEISVEALDADGAMACDTALINVEAASVATSDFEVSKSTIAVGERLSVHVGQPVDGYRYEWEMPGTTEEKKVAVNASAVYCHVGQYAITLHVISPDGQKISNSKSVKVVEVAPEADFDISSAIIKKGDAVILKDQSKYNPTSWQWLLRSPSKNILVDGQHSSLTMNSTGVYDITLRVANSKGKNSKSRKAALIVCNADSKTGLNFGGSAARVVLNKVPLSANASAFTIEWWMNPDKLLTYSNGIGEGENTFLLCNNGDGVMSLKMNGTAALSERKFVQPYEWHHYAVTFDHGRVSFYRDGILNVTRMHTTKTLPALQEFAIGLEHMRMTGMIDEFRIWASCLNKKTLQQYANEPIADVQQAEAAHQLVVYYDFNQGSGDVIDATSHKNTGLRRGFGPDGDAWSLSSGVFCLNFEPMAMREVTAEYLKNYKAPFAYDGTKVTHSVSTYCHAIADWTLENTNSVNNNVAGVYVDAHKRNLFTCQVGWEGFGDLVNHKAYQTVTLPAGEYEFVANYGFHKSPVNNTVLAVAAGKTLPNAKLCPAKALASVVMKPRSASMSNKLSFFLEEPTEVSLGVVINMAGKQCFVLNDFVLKTSTIERHEADGAKGYELTVDVTGYNTLYLPYAVAIPQGVTVYVAELIENGKVTLVPVTDGVIPAHTGVVVAAQPGKYRFVPTSAAGKAVSLLKGTAEEISVVPDQRYYLLSTANDPVFIHYQGDKIPAHQAYFTTEQSEASDVYTLDFVHVGVENILSGEQKAKEYDVVGRPVQQRTTGVHISKGKKIWVR